MKTLLLLLLVLVSTAQAHEVPPVPVHVHVLRVYDGDTFFVDVPGWHPAVGVKRGVRILGIDTPERKGAQCPEEKVLAERARVRLIELLQGKDVALHGLTAMDGFSRLLARPFADGVDVAAVLITEGLARPYGSGRYSWCE